MALPPLLALLVAAAPATFALDLGGPVLRLAVGLEVRAAPGAAHGPDRAGPEGPGGAGPAAADLALPLTWRTEPDGALVGLAQAPALDAEVRLAPRPGGARRLSVRLRWRRAAGLERAALRLGWAGAWPGAVGRDLRARPLDRPVRTGRGTPLLAWAGPALLTGGPGLVAAALAATPRDDGLTATLYLDDAAERPFATYRDCLEALPRLDGQAARSYAGLERKRPWPLAQRLPGQEDHLEATLWPRAPGGAGPLVPLRWPRGAGAAVVLTDHADRTEAGALRAVLYGHSDPRAEGGAGAGLLGRGLAVTRSFFAWPGPGTLADPATAALAWRLAAAGSEVALHSVSEGRDDRAQVAAGLEAAARWAPAVWIDHEPYVNCEALSARGATGGAPGITDLLVEGGVRWGWAAGDVAGFRRVEAADLFAAAPPGAPCPVLYPLPGEPGLWLFQTSFFYAPPAELAAALSDEALARLERDQGLFVGHTYLGAGPASTRGAQAEARLAVRRAPGGGLEVAPDLDEAFARLASHAAAGRLVSLPWSDAGDRLRALGEVEVRYRSDGAAEVVNHGAHGLEGLTLAAPVPGLDWWVDGRPAAADPAGARLWFDLPAGATRVVSATLLGGAVPLVMTPTPSLDSWATPGAP
ncbi:MAG: hypothetical protein IPO09_05070 [Anaeromyxobacter sp.]|nr:hypothetical protein [Anaeromyxobacter sp.]MBL0277479.1 hypothetical protein [Anaeromyxobacter sp.]